MASSTDFLTTALGIDKPTDEELRGGDAQPAESEAPIPATPEPASPPPPVEPGTAPAEPAAEPEAAQPDYAALYTAEVQARERERAGLLRQMQELRARGIEALPPSAQPEQPVQPLTVPIKFNEQGQAYIEAPVPPPPQPINPMTVAAQRGEQLRQNIILEDPVANARPMNRVYNAYIALDQMVGARFAQVPTPVRSIDDVLSYIQTQGLDREIAQQFPDVVRTYDDLELLLEAGLELSERKVRRIMRSTAARMKEYESKGNGAQPVAPAATAPPPKQLSGDKPRSQAKRGEAPGGAPPDRLAELDAKDPWRWTKAEAEEYARLAEADQG